jgi:hypothetical protein
MKKAEGTQEARFEWDMRKDRLIYEKENKIH